MMLDHRFMPSPQERYAVLTRQKAHMGNGVNELTWITQNSLDDQFAPELFGIFKLFENLKGSLNRYTSVG